MLVTSEILMQYYQLDSNANPFYKAQLRESLCDIFEQGHQKACSELITKNIKPILSDLISLAKKYYFGIRKNKFGVEVFCLVSKNTLKVELMCLFDLSMLVFKEAIKSYTMEAV